MTARSSRRIAVVGGGLGGTLAAILLQRAGHEVAVYEQAPMLERIGAGIFLSPNATLAMRGAGLYEALVATAALPDRFVHRDWDTGRITFGRNYGDFPRRYSARQVIMHRGDLQVLLTSGLAPDTLKLGKRLVGIDEKGSSLRLTFADGTGAAADLVVGADGINSHVREILMGAEKPVYTGYVAHRAIFPSDRLGMTVASATKWWADDRYIMDYYLTSKRDEIYFVTVVPSEWQGATYGPQPADLKAIKAAFEGFHPEVQRVIDACPGATIWPVLFRDPHQVWSSGRIVLLGDACHPMKPHMGQGAAMAMEDAAVLARCIEHYGAEDLTSAFHLYEALRFERTTRVKLESDKNEFMRYGSDCDWLFGYDAFAIPLIAPAKVS
jgi:6-hydroxynicotinate 3-monooxygenase